MVILNILCVLMLATGPASESSTLWYACHFFVVFNVAETLMRVWSSGFFAFILNESENDIFKLQGNRWDLFVSILTIGSLVFVQYQNHNRNGQFFEFLFGSEENGDSSNVGGYLGFIVIEFLL